MRPLARAAPPGSPGPLARHPTPCAQAGATARSRADSSRARSEADPGATLHARPSCRRGRCRPRRMRTTTRRRRGAARGGTRAAARRLSLHGEPSAAAGDRDAPAVGLERQREPGDVEEARRGERSRARSRWRASRTRPRRPSRWSVEPPAVDDRAPRRRRSAAGVGRAARRRRGRPSRSRAPRRRRCRPRRGPRRRRRRRRSASPSRARAARRRRPARRARRRRARRRARRRPPPPASASLPSPPPTRSRRGARCAAGRRPGRRAASPAPAARPSRSPRARRGRCARA